MNFKAKSERKQVNRRQRNRIFFMYFSSEKEGKYDKTFISLLLSIRSSLLKLMTMGKATLALRLRIHFSAILYHGERKEKRRVRLK